MPETYSREGIDRTAASLREHAARNGNPITHDEARSRVERAVRHEINIRRDEGGR